MIPLMYVNQLVPHVALKRGSLQKAATRACRNAIEFNSLPAMGKLIPGGYAGMRLHIKIGTPHPVRTVVLPPNSYCAKYGAHVHSPILYPLSYPSLT